MAAPNYSGNSLFQLPNMPSGLAAQNNSFQKGIANQQNALAATGLSNQYNLGMAGVNAGLATNAANNATATNIANNANLNALQTTGMNDSTSSWIAQQQNATQLQNTGLQQAGETQRTQLTTAEQLQAAQLGLTAQEYAADKQLAGTRFASSNQLAGTKYSADQSLAGVLHGQDLQQSRFNTLLPIFTQDATAMLNQNGSTNSIADLPPAPYINTAPVYSPDQIQQQTNLTRSKNDTTAASSTRAMQQDLAGRGFGSNSPLARELGLQNSGQAMAANTEAENNLRFGAAQANAQQVLSAQQAQSGNYQAQLQALWEQQRTKSQQTSALMSALASMA